MYFYNLEMNKRFETMKNQRSIFVITISLFCLIFLFACGGGEENKAKSRWLSFEIKGNDTINRTDTANMKQGPWFYFADKGKKAQKNVAPKLLVKGSYTDDKREGIWYYYSIETGLPSDTVFYRGDFPVED